MVPRILVHFYYEEALGDNYVEEVSKLGRHSLYVIHLMNTLW